MFIKLIQPRMTLRPMDNEFKRAMSPSLALLSLAALTPKEHTVFLEDENVQQLNMNDCPDVVGITVNLDASGRAYEIAESYRQRNIPVVAGGIHVSANSAEALQHFDAVCVGEAEYVWARILEDVAKKTLQKVYRSQETSMEKTPIPCRKIIEKDRYLYTNTVFTGRGCPFSCEFCYNSCEYVIHKTRNRPQDQVIEEILGMDTRHIMFIDDNFIGNIEWTREFLQQIKPLNLIWNAAVSTNLVNHPDLLDLMKESGCRSLFIGFESINPNAVKNAHKLQNKTCDYEKLIWAIHERGIMINASLVFGFDQDGPEVFKNTLEWLIKNKIETMTAHILTPYPGTVLYKKMLDAGRMIDFNSEHYNTAHVVFRPRNMTPKQLKEGYLWMYKKFYTFANIARRIPKDRSQRVAYLLFNLVYRKFGRRISILIEKMGCMHRLGKWARKLSYNI